MLNTVTDLLTEKNMMQAINNNRKIVINSDVNEFCVLPKKHGSSFKLSRLWSSFPVTGRAAKINLPKPQHSNKLWKTLPLPANTPYSCSFPTK